MGWIPKSEDAKLEFQEIALYPGDGRDGMEVAALQERLEDAAAAVKATTTAIRNKHKFMVLEGIMAMAAVAAKCGDPA